MFRSSKGRSLQLVLVIPFVLQIFGAVGLVGYLSFRNGQKAVSDLAEELTNEVAKTVDGHLDYYLSIPHTVNQINADAIQMGLLDVRDRTTTSRYFWKQMQAYDLTYIGYGLTTGEGVGAARYDGKTVTIDDWTEQPINNGLNYFTDEQGNRTTVNQPFDFNNFNEAWYTEPIEAGRPVWSRIYTWMFPGGYPYITASAGRPIYDENNQLLGMVAADIHLLKLSDFLRNLEISQAGQVFVVERDGTLIANSSEQEPFKLVNQVIERIDATDSPDPLIQNIAQQLQQSDNKFQTIDVVKHLQLRLDDEQYFVDIRPWQDEFGLDWVTVVAVPESEFMAQIHANNRTTALLCIGALIGATGFGMATARLIALPIQRLNQASKSIAAGDLEKNVEDSGIQELDTLAHSFNHMAHQLKETFRALEASKEELEDRVDERTSELKTALSELRRTQMQVIQSEKMSSLGQLVAGVAHEINNPVNFIHGNLTHVETYAQDLLHIIELFQDYYPEPAAEIQDEIEQAELDFIRDDLPKMLASMKLGTNRIREIVLSLRNFSRMDEAEMKAVDIHEGIESTLTILHNQLKANSKRPEIQIIRQYGELPLIECYAGQLNQVFMNILANAIDALEEMNRTRTLEELKAHPNQITIRTAVRDQQVEIAIADNGPGIPDEVRHRIFDPFFTTKPIGKGTGMGMSISYNIITEKHGGTIDCISTYSRGTEFIIKIPVCQNCRETHSEQSEANTVTV
ncbi:MAG: ATP-binding protein [Thainema sp.]